MSVPPSTVARLAAGLAVLVGFGDTLVALTLISYLREVGQVHVAAKSAMPTFLASVAGPALALVLAFVSGVIAGSFTGHWAQGRRRQVVLALVTLLFVVAALLNAGASGGLALLILASAMGALHGVLEDVPGAFVGLSESIGRLGEKLATTVAGGVSHGWQTDLLRWVGIFIGIVTGMILYPLFGLGGIWSAAALAGLLSIVTEISGSASPR